MKKICLGFCLGVTVVLGYQWITITSAAKIFGNLTYFTDCPYIAESITLMNGRQVVWNERLHASLYYLGYYVYGDFNRDGRKDAAVIISESEGGSRDARSLAFLINDGNRLIHRQSVYLGDRAIINALKKRGNKVIVEMFVHQDGDCMAGPTKRVKKIYEYLKPDPGNTTFPPKNWAG